MLELYLEIPRMRFPDLSLKQFKNVEVGFR